MVQGWESRAELAGKRREEARERKQARKGPKRITGDLALNFVLSNKYTDLSTRAIQAWVANELGGKPLCTAFFRAEACRLKRCKNSHEFSVSLMQNVEYHEGLDVEECEVFMDKYEDISLIATKDYPKLRLLFLDGVCIFDHAFPERWQQWCETIKAIAKLEEEAKTIDTPRKPTLLSTIREVCEPDDCSSTASSLVVHGVGVALGSVVISVPHAQSLLINLSKTASGVLEHISSFLSDYELCQFHMTCGVSRGVIASDDLLHYRHRVFLDERTPSGKELSKMRKQEKKKKLKAANSKVANKKDGHKKVKVCRR